METSCQQVQEALVEVRGEIGRVSEAEHEHLVTCSDCGAVAASEAAFDSIMSQVLPPDDPELQEQIVAAVGALSRSRRALALLPVAMSFLVAAVGALLVGGIPGSGLLSLLPQWSAQGWASLLQGVADWNVVVMTSARAAHAVIPSAVHMTAALLASLGLVTLATSVRSLRTSRAWQNKH